MKAEVSTHAICDELETFMKQLERGVHTGGGLLGRVAEFLVGQRDSSFRRTTCSQRDLVRKSAFMWLKTISTTGAQLMPPFWIFSSSMACQARR